MLIIERKVFRVSHEEVYSKGNVNFCDELCENDLKLHYPAIANQKPGIAAFKESERAFHRAFPNKKARIEEYILVAHKTITVRWSCQGSHEGELYGVAPTHRTFFLTGISIIDLQMEKFQKYGSPGIGLAFWSSQGISHPIHALL